jgi:NodT family efflux transporter outer membrane factor (OMF) lipoprotein
MKIVHVKTRVIASLIALAGLAGCNLAPHYERPKSAVVDGFKEAVPTDQRFEGWTPAEPKDSEIPNNWWEVYRDPDLNDLEGRVAVSNQTVAAAEANYRAARALVVAAQAAFFPTLSLNPSATRSRTSASIANGGASGGTGSGGATTPHNVFMLPLEAAYQVDLWGSIRNAVAQNRFMAQVSAAQVVTALLSTQSQLAQDYFQLRAVDEQRRILDATLANYEASIHLINTLMKNGIDSSEDLAAAENQLYTAEAAATDLGVARAQYEHAIAVLIGVPPAKFSLGLKSYHPLLPTIPVALPSQLLERRADIAAAERQVAATNAAIGVARAAFFPSLSLSATGGYQAQSASRLLDWPNRFWSVGPAVAQTLFDGGARRAAVAQARAQNDQATANYRQAVLVAFESVEDNLASLRVLSKELEQRHKAALAAQRTVELSVVRYRNGVDSYINVIAAQNTFLVSRQAELQAQLARQIASVNLINNLGGGWTTSDWAATERISRGVPGAAGAAEVPAANAGPGIPNPPQPPAHEARPEDLLKQNQEAMADSPP